ncbi:MAG: hypothetical protein GXO70_01490 [Acidobacteria bacterium]|nr:hypothetical protein [Acidobacteriota bacterium]
MNLLKRTDVLFLIYGCQWFALFLIQNAVPDYYLVGMTFFFLLVAPRPWIFLIAQIVFVVVSPPAVFRAISFGILFLFLRDKKVPFRISLVLLILLFLLLARYDGFRIPVVFPGVLALGALVYAISRVKGLVKVLTPALPVYLITSVMYVFFYLFWEHAYRFKPVSVIPLDLIQLTAVAALFCTIRPGGDCGNERNEAAGVESVDICVDSGRNI